MTWYLSTGTTLPNLHQTMVYAVSTHNIDSLCLIDVHTIVMDIIIQVFKSCKPI